MAQPEASAKNEPDWLPEMLHIYQFLNLALLHDESSQRRIVLLVIVVARRSARDARMLHRRRVTNPQCSSQRCHVAAREWTSLLRGGWNVTLTQGYCTGEQCKKYTVYIRTVQEIYRARNIHFLAGQEIQGAAARGQSHREGRQ